MRIGEHTSLRGCRPTRWRFVDVDVPSSSKPGDSDSLLRKFGTPGIVNEGVL